MKKYRVWNIAEKYFYNENEVLLSPNGKLKYYYRGNEYSDETPYWGELYSTTVTQYSTGLVDVNRVEIFEGDVIRLGDSHEYNGSFGQVIFQFGSFMLRSQSGGIYQDSYIGFTDGEIVGHIYEKSQSNYNFL